MWHLVQRYLEETPHFLAEHQRASYRRFCDEGIHAAVKTRVKCDGVKLLDELSEQDAILAGKTYGYRLVALNGRAETFLGTVPRITEGGYFIVFGKESFVPIEEVPSEASPQWTQRINIKDRYLWSVAHNGITVSVVADTATEEHGEIEVLVPGATAPMPLFLLLRAMGVLSDRDICDHCLLGLEDNERLRPSIYAAGQIYTMHGARAYVQSRGGVGGWWDAEPEAKVLQVGYLVRALVRVLAGLDEVPCEDSHLDKGIVLCGPLLERWFKEALDAHLDLKAPDCDLCDHCAADGLGSRFAQRFPTSEPFNYFARVAAVREVTTLGERLHPTHYGIYDAVEWVGNKKQLALLTRVTTGEIDISDLLKTLPLVKLESATPLQHGRLVRVLLNGAWIASTNDPGELVRLLKLARRQPSVNATEKEKEKEKEAVAPKRSPFEDLNVHWAVMKSEIHVRTTAGRVQRPLLYVDEHGRLSSDDGVEGWTWQKPGVVEFVDASEASAALIAPTVGEMQKYHTHAELHGALVLGARTHLLAAVPHHTPAPDLRRLSQHATDLCPLSHAEAPLVQSAFYTLAAKCPPFGVNAVVAIASYEGCDGGAILLNQAAIDRGLFSLAAFKTLESRCQVSVAPGDEVVAGASLARDLIAETAGTVETVSKVGDRTEVRVRYRSSPAAGDVFMLRNGARLVCGRVCRETDMPFTKEGLRPDVILPPSGEPSVVAALLEGLAAKVHVLHGTLGDGTAFEQSDRFTFYVNELKRRGFKSAGDEVLYHGITGGIIETPFFVGVLYISPLLREEPPCEARGPVSMVTRQPLRGVMFDGDACIASGMAATLQDAFVRRSDGEHAYVDNVSGLFAINNVDTDTKVAPSVDGPLEFDGDLTLRPCKNGNNTFRRLTVPRAFRVLSQELTMANVQMRLVTAPPRLQAFDVDQQARGHFRAMVPITPEVLDNLFGASFDLGACFDPRWRSFTATHKATLFPFVTTPERLKMLEATSFEINPTSDMRPAVYNADKLDQDVYASMDWRSGRHTLKYCFDKLNTGVFVRIRNNRIVNFDPIGNESFSNDFLHRLSLDGKTAATPEALRAALGSPHPARWTAVGRLLKLDLAPSDNFLAQAYDMLAETCSHRTVHDCMFVVNRTDHPVLGADGFEPFPTFYGKNKKRDPSWKESFIPILSQCSSAAHADVPIPTGMDWEAISGKYFASYKRAVLQCKNRCPNTMQVAWADRTASVELDTGRKLPVFYWEGAPVVGDDQHPRALLQKAAEDYAKKGRRTEVTQSGLLKVQPTPLPKSRVYTSFVKSHNLVLVQKELSKTGMAAPTSLASQATQYKFAFHVEGNGAAPDLGALFKYGFCVLRVQSEYALWFDPLLRGGAVEDYKEDWCFLALRRDLADLDSTIEWCLDNDDKCRRIAENGRRFFDGYLTKTYVYDYLSATLNAVSSRQRTTERTSDEELTWTKDLKEMYGKNLEPEWRALSLDRASSAPMHTVLLVTTFHGGPAQTAELAEFMKHYQTRNILVMKHTHAVANRGALYNAAYTFVRKYAPDITTLVFLDLKARFKPDFARLFFGAGADKGVIDFGRLVGMPFGWAVRFSVDAYGDMNGFPNTFYGNEPAESVAAGERLYRIRKKWTFYYPDTPTDILTATIPEPDPPKPLTPEAHALVLLDRVHWKMDGANTIQYKTVAHTEGDWLQRPATTSPNIRTLTVQLIPEAAITAVAPPQKPLDAATEANAANAATDANAANAAQEPEPTPVLIEAAPEVVEIHLDQQKEPEEVLSILHNTETMASGNNASETKVIKFD